jgi:proton-translocating NADH-quinone oxidoreductase chain M
MILSFLIILPLIGALLAYFVPRFARNIALATILCTAGVATLSLGLFHGTGLQFLEQHPWLNVGKFQMSYHLGVDGISYVLVLLTVLLGIVAVLVSRREIHTREPAYYSILLALIAAIIGVFSSLDLILFFVFWEAVLVLTFLLILIWGGDNRKYAAMKFLLYTGLGSAALLLAIILLGVYATTDFTTLGAIPVNLQYVIFGLILFACFVKMPIVPFHTWLPDAHVQAPTAGSILLAGVLLKMGSYALLRFAVIFTITKELSMFLFIMGVITIIYGAWVCLAQNNLKRLIAYSSVNHMGFVLVGIATGTALGITGAMFEMISHGLIAALLFALAGAVHQQTGTFDLDALHGLITKMPRTGWLLVIGSLAGLGLPGMTGFIAEFLIFKASFATFGLLTLIPIAGMILTGGYFLRLLAKAVFGKGKLAATEVGSTPFFLLLIFIVILGVLPFLLLRYIGA